MSPEPLTPWMSLEDLLSLPLAERIGYVRKNLPSPRSTARNPHMSHDDFAVLVGAPDRGAPIGWEKGREPRAYREKIAAVTPYPVAAFGAPGEAELVRETLGRRLLRVEAMVADLAHNQRVLLEHLGLAPDADGQLVATRAAPRAQPRKGRRRASAS